MLEAPTMKTKRLAGWFGSNTTKAALVGVQLGKLKWCGVPFSGGCPELPYIDTNCGVAGDVHRHIINLSRVIRCKTQKDRLKELLNPIILHPQELADAQRRCIERESEGDAPMFDRGRRSEMPQHGDVEWAADYAVCCWMGRGGHAGKKTEFKQNLAMRWTVSGGGSSKRFRSFIDSLDAWQLCLQRWDFSVTDVFAFLTHVQDKKGYGLYIDAPWPVLGDEYKHGFTEAKQRMLAEKLARFKETRVVIRYGEHALIRYLYGSKNWTWIEAVTRNQRNKAVAESLIINGPAYDGPCSTEQEEDQEDDDDGDCEGNEELP